MHHVTLNIFSPAEPNRRSLSSTPILESSEDGTVHFVQVEVINRLRKTFEKVDIEGSDLLLEDARRVEAVLSNNRMADNPLIKSLYQKVKDLGPAVPFSILSEGGIRIQGSVRRYDINFSYDKSLPVEVQIKIKNFLQAFSVGVIEERDDLAHRPTLMNLRAE